MAVGEDEVAATRGQFHLGHRPALDGIRGLGMLSVVVFHTMTYLVDWYGPYGHTVLPGSFIAVDVFFALSGFLITSLLLEERRRTGEVSMRRFYIRRGLRLLPALYATIAGFGVVFLFSGDATLRSYVSAVVKMLTYSSNFFIGKDVFLTSWFGQTWSLAIEEQFYIVWPVVLVGLLYVFRRRPQALAGVLAAVIVAVVAWRIVLLHEHHMLWSDVYYRTDARIDQPLVGAMLALLLHFGIVPEKPRPWLGLAGLAGWMAATALASPFHPSYFQWVAPAMLVASCATILGVLHGRGIAAAILGSRPLRWFGRISYTLYLVHVGVFELVRVHIHGEGRNWLRIIVANGVALVVTVIVHRAIEAPALRLKDRWAPSRSPRMAAAAVET
jgi:peptidoglycan/LPS O-acetylase OafA/YrhL